MGMVKHIDTDLNHVIDSLVRTTMDIEIIVIVDSVYQFFIFFYLLSLELFISIQEIRSKILNHPIIILIYFQYLTFFQSNQLRPVLQ